MPSRKQRRRELKGRRHEYETVWLDAEGNELDEPPPDAVEEREKREPAKGAATKGKPQRPQRTMRTRVPPAPSWNRAAKRAGLLGIVVFFLFYIAGGKSGNRLGSALGLAVLYTVLFIPFTFVIDRFTYNRYQRQQQGAAKPPTKKR